MIVHFCDPTEESQATMKIAAVFVFVGVLAAFVCDSNAEFGVGGPGFGWVIGQQASANGISIAIEAALAKANPAEFPPELQVIFKLENAIENWNPNH